MKIRNLIKSLFEKLQDSLITIIIDAIVILIANRFFPNVIAEQNIEYSWKIVILVVLFIINMFALMAIQKSYHRYKFTITDEHAIMEYQRDIVKVYQEFNCFSRFLKANKMHTKKTWFSDESKTLIATTEGFSIEPIREVGNDNEYYVVFPKDYFFHENIHYCTEFTGINKKRNYKNFYWVDIDCPIRKLTLEVRLPKDACNGTIKRKQFLNYENAPGTEVTEIKNFTGVHTWEIYNPHVNWSYVLEWEWSDSEQAEIKRVAGKHKDVEN